MSDLQLFAMKFAKKQKNYVTGFKVSSQFTYCKVTNMSKTLDPFWEYAKPVDPHNRQKLRYNMGGKEMTGG